MDFRTLAVHAGRDASEPLAVCATAGYSFGGYDHGSAVMALKEPGDVDAGVSNPTVAVFEQRLAALECGVAAIATASGAAARATVVQTLAGPGENIVVCSAVDGGTLEQFKHGLVARRAQFRFAAKPTVAAAARLIDARTRGLYLCSGRNPLVSVVQETSMFAALANQRGIPLIVDNTLGAGGYLFRPITHGAAIVIHSSTRYIGGHDTAEDGGVIVDAGSFQWDNGKFPGFTTASSLHRSVNFWASYRQHGGLNLAFAMKARMEAQQLTGTAMNPLTAFQLLYGLETLALRMDRMVQNARVLTMRLSGNLCIDWVRQFGRPLFADLADTSLVDPPGTEPPSARSVGALDAPPDPPADDKDDRDDGDSVRALDDSALRTDYETDEDDSEYGFGGGVRDLDERSSSSAPVAPRAADDSDSDDGELDDGKRAEMAQRRAEREREERVALQQEKAERRRWPGAFWVAFGIRGGSAVGQRFASALKLIQERDDCTRSIDTHIRVKPAACEVMRGLPLGDDPHSECAIVQLSMGLEHIRDVVDDIEAALAQSGAPEREPDPLDLSDPLGERDEGDESPRSTVTDVDFIRQERLRLLQEKETWERERKNMQHKYERAEKEKEDSIAAIEREKIELSQRVVHLEKKVNKTKLCALL